MNEKSSRWIWILLRRVASYAVLGGMATALVGALLIAASGATVGAVLDAGRPRVPFKLEMTFYGAAFGIMFGGMAGGIAGLILFGITGFGHAARRSFLPPKSILASALIGMSIATLAVMTSFFAGCAIISWVRGAAFASLVESGVMFILFAAPAVMVCGAIAGALFGFRRETEAQRAAPALPIEPT